MDASTLLKGQGWRGEGHSLDTTNRGLARPLLVQHKADALGIGNKKHDFSDQWWLTNFDKSLKGVGKPAVAVRYCLQRSMYDGQSNMHLGRAYRSTTAQRLQVQQPLYKFHQGRDHGKHYRERRPLSLIHI